MPYWNPERWPNRRSDQQAQDAEENHVRPCDSNAEANMENLTGELFMQLPAAAT
jgi:hypothetical protein